MLEYVHGSAYYFQREAYPSKNVDYLVRKNLLDEQFKITAKGRWVIRKLRKSKVPKDGCDNLKIKESIYIIKNINYLIEQETYDWNKDKKDLNHERDRGHF